MKNNSSPNARVAWRETPAKVMKDFSRGKKPLLTIPPAAMGALAAQDNYSTEELR